MHAVLVVEKYSVCALLFVASSTSALQWQDNMILHTQQNTTNENVCRTPSFSSFIHYLCCEVVTWTW